MRRYLKMIGLLIVQQLKIRLEYPVDFFISVISQVVIQLAGLLTIWLVMLYVPELSGWNFEQVVLIYGRLTICFGLCNLFSENLWVFHWVFVDQGRLDAMLVRPFDPLLNVISDRFNINAIGDTLIGLGMIIYSMSALHVPWSFFQIAYLLASIVSGSVIFFSLTLITTIPSLFMIPSHEITFAVFKNFEFAKYPLHIFPRVIIFIVTWIIPYGFVSYYPAGHLLGQETGVPFWVGFLVAAVLLFMAVKLWRFGLRHYSGSGT